MRPPRLGGNKRVGVFASRSPFRPNSIGLSAVNLLAIEDHHEFGISLKAGGLDLIDGTPVFDIKPYLPHSDAITEATTGYSPPVIERLPIHWKCKKIVPLTDIIEQTLSLDPRPAYKEDEKQYGTMIAGRNIIWKVLNERIEVIEIQ